MPTEEERDMQPVDNATTEEKLDLPPPEEERELAPSGSAAEESDKEEDPKQEENSSIVVANIPKEAEEDGVVTQPKSCANSTFDKLVIKLTTDFFDHNEFSKELCNDMEKLAEISLQKTNDGVTLEVQKEALKQGWQAFVGKLPESMKSNPDIHMRKQWLMTGGLKTLQDVFPLFPTISLEGLLPQVDFA